MPSFVPLRRTYSALSSLSSSDDTDSASIKEIVVQPSDSNPRTIHRYSFLIRFIIFVILELAFISLVTAALRRPIILHVSFTNSEVKGAVTVVAIAWHALAVYVVKDILLNVFSAEWMRQYDGSKRFTLQDLDVVSRLTTGFIDHARHCMSTRATLPFCLSFLSLLLLMLLNGLSPSAIGIDLVYHKYQATTHVASLTLTTEGGSSLAGYQNSRATTMVQFEIIQSIATVGFSSNKPNLLIPWPSSNSVSDNISMTYESDVIWSNMSCSWKAPSTSDISVMISVDDNRQPKPFSMMVAADLRYFPAVLPLFPAFNDSSLIAILFAHGDHVEHLNLLSSLVPCNATFYGNYFSTMVPKCSTMFISALVCDPQFQILPATINVTTSSLEATLLPGTPSVKNIPIQAAKNFFTSALIDAIGTTGFLSDTSAQLFFERERGLLSGPLALEHINQNMTKAFASAAKAYLSGYVPSDSLDLTTPPSFSMVNTSAVIEEQRLALVGRKPFFIASTAIVGLLVILLGAIVAIIRPDQLESFELENIVRRLN